MNKPKITIEYCTKCGWLLRAAWMAQEILSTFTEDVAEVALKPGETGGVFQITIEDKIIFSRKEAGRFPEAKEIKQKVRDIIDPDRDLGHVDGHRKDSIE